MPHILEPISCKPKFSWLAVDQCKPLLYVWYTGCMLLWKCCMFTLVSCLRLLQQLECDTHSLCTRSSHGNSCCMHYACTWISGWTRQGTATVPLQSLLIYLITVKNTVNNNDN